MRKDASPSTTISTEKRHALKLRQVLVGLEMRQTDEKLLQYLDYLRKLIPIEAVDFIHQLSSFHLFGHLFKDNDQLATQQADQKKQMLGSMRKQIQHHFRTSQSCKLSHNVRIGDPLAGLLRRAEELNPDLVLVGQKTYEGGHGVLSRKLAGLLQTNALIVPQRAKLSLQKIVVPVDFSEPSRRALEMALQLQRQLPQKPAIHCLHIFAMPDFAEPASLSRVVRTDQEHSLAEFVQSYAEQADGELEAVLLEKELNTRTGIYVLEYALAEAADLIVIGARGLSPIERMLMGSVTERLLSLNDNIPTLIVK